MFLTVRPNTAATDRKLEEVFQDLAQEQDAGKKELLYAQWHEVDEQQWPLRINWTNPTDRNHLRQHRHWFSTPTQTFKRSGLKNVFLPDHTFTQDTDYK